MEPTRSCHPLKIAVLERGTGMPCRNEPARGTPQWALPRGTDSANAGAPATLKILDIHGSNPTGRVSPTPSPEPVRRKHMCPLRAPVSRPANRLPSIFNDARCPIRHRDEAAPGPPPRELRVSDHREHPDRSIVNSNLGSS